MHGEGGNERNELKAYVLAPALVTHKHQLLVVEAKQKEQYLENVAILSSLEGLARAATRGTEASSLTCGACTGNTQTPVASIGGKANKTTPGKSCHPLLV